ncbi:porin [Candidatus Pelagibacter ubique]|nr:porin [Candidatus Pelagibacter ubique]
MNTFKKIGLTALAGSLVAVSVNAADLSVTGAAGITFAGQDKTTKGNGWSMTDNMTFAGSSELDNGWTVSTSFLLDNSDGAASQIFDSRSLKIEMADMGTLTFTGHDGGSAMNDVDDVMPYAGGNEGWDLVGTAATAKFGRVAGTGGTNQFKYNNSTLMDGLSVTASYQPSNATQVEGTVSYAVAYTGVEGLTVGYGADENGLLGTAAIDAETMYIKYAYGPITVGMQESETDANTSANSDEFSAMGISYAVSDDLTISYTESAYDAGDKASDEEHTMIGASYTMGSMSLAVSVNDVKNMGGSTATADDVSGYELALSFVF